MENPIKKSRRLMPKMFRVFTLYIFVTLAVFFGYVQVFGGLTPTTISLPTGGVNANEDTAFSDLVANIMSVKSLSVDDFSLSASLADGTQIAIGGDVAFVTETQSVYIDLDVTYNDSLIQVGAVYTTPDLYLTLAGETYKFEVQQMTTAAGDFDVQQVLDFVMQYVPVDMDKVNEILVKLGIDLNDIGGLMQKLSIENKDLETGGHEFVISLGSVISAQIITDKDFNISSIRLRDIRAANNVIKFKAPSVLMNDVAISDMFAVPETYTDLSGFTSYVDYAKNLAANDVVKVEADVQIAGHRANADLYVDKTDGLKVMAQTNVEGINVSAIYCDKMVYVDVENLKFAFDIDDYKLWADTIENLVEQHTSRTIAEIVNEFTKKFAGVDLEQININEIDFEAEAKKLVLAAFDNFDQVNMLLPQQTVETENSFEMIWDNGLNVRLENADDVLSGIQIVYEDNYANLAISSTTENVVVSGEYYDLTQLLPLVDVVDKIVVARQAEGQIVATYKGYELTADYQIDLRDEIKAKITLKTPVKDIEIFANLEKAYFVVDDVVLEISYDKFDLYLADLQELLGIETEVAGDLNGAMTDTIKEVLQTLNISNREDAVMAVQYLSHNILVSADQNAITFDYGYQGLNVGGNIQAANGVEIEMPIATDKFEDLLVKAKNLKDYIEGNVYAAQFVVNYKDTTIYGGVQADLNNGVYGISTIYDDKTLYATYQNGRVYLQINENKIRLDVDNAKELVDIVLPILEANNLELGLNVDTEKYLGVAKDKLSDITIEDLLENFTFYLVGNLDKLMFYGNYNANDFVVSVKFVDNNLKRIEVTAEDLNAYVNIVPFGLGDIEPEDYYDVLGAQRGTLTLDVDGKEISVALALDFTDKIYLNAQTTLFGENFEVIVLDNMLYVKAGELTFGTDFNNLNELIEYVVDTFALTLPEVSTDVDLETIKDLDINEILNQFTCVVAGDELRFEYENISLTLAQADDVVAVAPETYKEMTEVVDAVKVVLDAIENKTAEFDFEVSYQGYTISGTMKFDGNILEVVANYDEYQVYARLENNVVYVAYGDLKIKLDIAQMTDVDVAELVERVKALLADNNVDISMFDELLTKVDGLKDVSVDELLEDINIALKGNFEDIKLTLAKEDKQVDVEIEMTDDLPSAIYVDALDEISLQLLNIKYQTQIGDIDADEFYDIAQLKVLLDFAQDVLENKQASGTIQANVEGHDISVEYVVDFADSLKARFETTLFGENVVVYVTTEQITIQIGEALVKASVADVDEYVAKIEELFDVALADKIAELKNQEIDVNALIRSLASEMENVVLGQTEENLLVVNYKDNQVSLTYENGILSVELVGEFNLSLTAQATHVEILTPETEEDIASVLAKVENLIDYVNGNVYAVEFAGSYNGYQLAGKVSVDLNNEIFDIDLTYQNRTIKVIYTNGTAYVEFDQTKIKVNIEKVKDIVDIVLPILEANGINTEMPDFDTDKFLKDLLGEDVLSMRMEDLFEKLTLDIDGSLSDLTLAATLDADKLISGNVAIEFVDNKLNAISVEAFDFALHVDIVAFVEPTLVAEDYYDVLGAQRGTLTLDVDGKEISVALALDFTDKIYLNAQTTLFGENFEVIVLDNMLYVKAGELTLGTDFNNLNELIEYVVDTFALTLPEVSTDVDLETIKDLDINEILNQFTCVVAGDELRFEYENISLTLAQADDVVAVAPETYENLKDLVDVAKNMTDMLENKLVEADIVLNYNGFELFGTLKINASDIEVVIELASEDLMIRKHENTLYVAYGNMKWKFALSQNSSVDLSVDLKEILREITSDDFRVDINFGAFEKLVTMLRDYELSDYIENTKIDLNGTLNNLQIAIAKEDEEIATLAIKLANKKLDVLEIAVCDTISLKVELNDVENSTMAEFDEDVFATYCDDLLESVLDSMKVRENVYALTSDIAFRYSNNAFYGEIAAMVTYDETQDTMLGHFVPALQVHTTALGFDTYIYLINERVYIDVQGLQLYADLNQTTLDEVMTFVEEYFNMTLNVDTYALSAVTGFRYILPALDRIYGSWVETLIDNVSFEGFQIAVEDEFWYGTDSKFERTILQAFTDNDQGMIIPRKVIVGANIIDPNTTIYNDYSNYWLDNEEEVTEHLNFAGYLTNLKVGSYVDNLNEIFVGANNGEIVGLKSTYGTSNITEYNSYKTIIEMVETLLDYANGLKYQGSINADISGATTLKLGANINIEIGDLAPGETNPEGFQLFDDKYIKVQGAFSLKNSVEHLINMFYESNKTSALYVTYTHGNFIKSNTGSIKSRIAGADKTFKAKINTINMSDIVAMVLKFANINLGEEMEENLNLSECTTDFSYVQSLLGIGGKDVSSELSQGDQLISTIESVTSIIKNIRLTKVGNTTTLSVVVNWQDHDATISIIFKQESAGLKFRKLTVNNFVFGDNTINLEINVEDFNAANFDYNTSASHIDFSDVSSFIDVAVTTLNTKNWGFKGSADVSIGNGLYTINVGYDLYACLDENNELYMYIELDVPFKASVTAQALPNPDYTVYIVGGSYDRRTSVIEFKNGYLSIVQYTYGVKTTALGSKSDKVRGYGHGDNWRYSKDQIAANAMKIMAQALGLSETAFDIIKAAINSIDAHPTIEEALLGFSKTSSGYSLKVNAENLTGMNGVEDMTLNITTSKAYNVRIDGVDQGPHKFIDSISTELKIGSLLSIPITLNSKTGTSYKTNGGKVIYTNDYYRQIYAYQIKTLNFETNCNQYFEAIVKPAADPITLPTPTDYIVDNGTTYTSYEFAGWYTTENFASGTEYTENKMPFGDTTLYAKWNKDVKYYRSVTFNTNAPVSVAQVRDVEGRTYTLPILADYVVDDGVTRTEYTFDSWWTSADFVTGYQVTTAIIPSQDITLYARWGEYVQYYRTITFETNNDEEQIASITALVNADITIPNPLKIKQETSGNMTTFYKFDGWYTTANFVSGTKFESVKMPSASVTLYAKWSVDKIERSYQVNLYDNSTLVDTIRVAAGDTFSLTGLNKVNNTTKFYTDSNFTTLLTNYVMPENDLNVYVRNKYTLTIRYYNSSYVQQTTTIEHYQGESFAGDISNSMKLATIIIDSGSGTNFERMRYTYNGFYVGSTQTDYVMTNADMAIESKYTAQKQYKVTFDVSWYNPGWWINNGTIQTAPTAPADQYVNAGSTLNLSGFTATIKVKYGINYTYVTNGWSTSVANSSSKGVQSVKVNGSMTLYAVWKKK